MQRGRQIHGAPVAHVGALARGRQADDDESAGARTLDAQVRGGTSHQVRDRELQSAAVQLA